MVWLFIIFPKSCIIPSTPLNTLNTHHEEVHSGEKTDRLYEARECTLKHKVMKTKKVPLDIDLHKINRLITYAYWSLSHVLLQNKHQTALRFKK